MKVPDRIIQLVEYFYQELGRLFINADYRHNSGLFHFQNEKGRENSDGFTLNLTIDNSILTLIIQKLYPPESPYKFSVIPVKIFTLSVCYTPNATN